MKMEKDPAGNDIRKARRSRRLPPNAICLCGEDRPEALELHHPSGHANAPDLVVVRCKNCHAADGEAHRDAGVDLSHQAARTLLERLEAALGGLGEFLRTLGDQLETWAVFLAGLVRVLDSRLAGWREWPEMQP
jgi:hypothetical protein